VPDQELEPPELPEPLDPDEPPEPDERELRFAAEPVDFELLLALRFVPDEPEPDDRDVLRFDAEAPDERDELPDDFFVPDEPDREEPLDRDDEDEDALRDVPPERDDEDDERERLLDDDVPAGLRSLAGTSVLMTALTSCLSWPSRNFCIRSSWRRCSFASFAVSLSPSSLAKFSITL
jgi:hypothetical protein